MGIKGFQKGNVAGFKHGMTHTPEHTAWADMKKRCHSPASKFYSYYGGRGISVYPEWRESFEAFLSYIGQRPSPLHTLDRYPDQNGNYEPGNVRWATRKEQVRNRRVTVMVEYCGKRMSLAEAGELLGYNYKMLTGRVNRGETPEQAISRPAKFTRKPNQ